MHVDDCSELPQPPSTRYAILLLLSHTLASPFPPLPSSCPLPVFLSSYGTATLGLSIATAVESSIDLHEHIQREWKEEGEEEEGAGEARRMIKPPPPTHTHT